MAPGKLVLGPEETRAAPAIKTFLQISAMCPRSDQTILQKQAQQSPDDPLKTTSKVQQDIQEGESLLFKGLIHLLASATHSLATSNER